MNTLRVTDEGRGIISAGFTLTNIHRKPVGIVRISEWVFVGGSSEHISTSTARRKTGMKRMRVGLMAAPLGADKQSKKEVITRGERYLSLTAE